MRNNRQRDEELDIMAEHNEWKWQEYGTAWHGVGIYHVTLTIPTREPLLGTLVIPENDPKQAYIERTELGNKLIDCLWTVPRHHPDVRIICFTLMPDHLHTVWHVVRPMPTGIKTVVRGFWQAVKKIGREHSMSVYPNDIRENEHREGEEVPDNIRDNGHREGEGAPDSIRQNEHREATENSGQVNPIFTEMPFIRPLLRRGQLNNMMRYVRLNPQRLATKRLKPGYFRVQEEIEIAGRKYAGVGNVKLLLAEHFKPVHVRSCWVEDAERHGYDQPLRDYMNGCVLILSPWEYDADKRHVTRAECVAMNAMAEEICEVSK